jgi:Mn-dependent DtxR family transcriptional regulator
MTTKAAQKQLRNARQRRYYRLKTSGKRIFRYTANEDRVIEALLASHLVTDEESRDLTKVESELAGVVNILLERWVRECLEQ